AERRALALVSICQDYLYEETSPGDTPPAEVTVVVDARTATEANGESGVAVLGGPRVGRKALEGVLCNSIAEVIGVAEDGRPLDLGRKSRAVSPVLRRFVLARDHGCTAEGCSSHYRIEVHHTVPWSEGGATDAADLVSLCWFHHHIVIHRLGLEILRLGTSRVRLVRPS
ncbi:MAG TPA: HNH endonuclease, partial [Acidimicrobiia bacterium]|nr:HNH endonuclease [Acidimicrobiia bacterium]